MKTANELTVGEYFVGHVWQDEFLAERNKRRFPGQLVPVVSILPCASDYGVKEVMALFASLPSDSTLQLSSGLGLWVCGVREKRSGCVRLIDWVPARPRVTETEAV